MPTLQERIDRIGAELVHDTFSHSDIVCKPEEGIIPRCLILEEKDRDQNTRGAIVVGINPGRASEKECRHYREHGCTYDAVRDYWWNVRGYDHPYYKQLRQFLDEAGLRGPILWTELVHCESAAHVKELSVQTIRASIDRYLVREIASVPDQWPLIGVSAEAYKILAYRFPRRLVIGVPHPTGSRQGQFQRELMRAGRLAPLAKQQIANFLNDGNGAGIFQCRKGDCRFR